MNSKEHLAPSTSCDTLSTTAPEAQWNLRMCMPILKQETVECINEEVSPCSEDMNPSEHLESPKYVNYYDSMGFEMEILKKEIPEDFSINYTMVSENKEFLELIDKQEVDHENTEEELSLIINEENENGNYQFIVKMEKPEEDQYLFDNAGATSVCHYDVLMNPQEVECKLCCRTFKNGFNLLRHNIEHIKVEINTSDDNSKVMELHQRQYCDESFNHDNMLAHDGDVHTKKIDKGELRGKNFKSAPNLKRSEMLLHKQMSPNQVTGNSMKCKYCNVDYKRLDILYKHMEQCGTGKEGEEMKYKCDPCESTFRSKYNFIEHTKRMHYDYGRSTFDCWCGKQYRTLIHLRVHMRQQHDGKKKR